MKSPIKHVVSIHDFSDAQLFDAILPGAQKAIQTIQKRIPQKKNQNKKIQFAFFEPSTRTRGSYVEAAQMLGCRYDVVMGAEATSLSKKESIANTMRMFALYNADVIVTRTKIEGAQKFASELLEQEGFNVAVHNAGDGTNEHPTQTILDLLTISEHLGRLDNFTIGFFGDLKYGRTVHSLLTALARRKKVNVVLVSTPETALQESYKRLFEGRVAEAETLEALCSCDVIYGARIQEERFDIDPQLLVELRNRFTVTSDVLDLWKKKVIIMHPMPYVQEFPPQVRTDRHIIIDSQAWHGMPARYFLLEQSLRNTKIKTSVRNEPNTILDVVVKKTLSEYLQQQMARKKKDTYFSPLKEGTVIDHIPDGLGIKIEQYLEQTDQLLEDGVVTHLTRVPSGRLGKKEVLLLENNFLNDQVKTAIASLAPVISFNEMQQGKYRKIKAKAPSVIKGIGECPNGWCITNHDPEAEPRFVHNHDGLICYYCEKEFPQSEVI